MSTNYIQRARYRGVPATCAVGKRMDFHMSNNYRQRLGAHISVTCLWKHSKVCWNILGNRRLTFCSGLGIILRIVYGRSRPSQSPKILSTPQNGSKRYSEVRFLYIRPREIMMCGRWMLKISRLLTRTKLFRCLRSIGGSGLEMMRWSNLPSMAIFR